MPSVYVTQDIGGIRFRLDLGPMTGFDPVWREPLHAVVVVLSLVAALLLLLLQRARKQHYTLLRRMLPSKVIRTLHRVRTSGVGRVVIFCALLRLIACVVGSSIFPSTARQP